MSYAAAWRARLEMMRPGNAAMAAVGVAVGALAAAPFGAGFPWLPLTAAMVAAFLVTSFGNVLNDILDLRVDRNAHPRRPLPSGRVQVREAAGFAAILLLLGLWEAWVAGGLALLAFAAANAVLLALYAARLKAHAVTGHIVVGLLVASTFPFGALAADATSPVAWGSLWGLCLMAFLTTVARELHKSLEDAPHDADRQTLARRAPAAARAAATTAVLIAVAAAAWMALPVAHPWWLSPPRAWSEGPLPGFWRLILVPALALFIMAATRPPAVAQRLLKGAMLVALAAFAWGGLVSG